MSEVLIYRGNIVNADVQCIVNPANPSLMPGSGVNRAIFYSAGEDLYNHIIKLNKTLEPGQALITPGFNITAEYIIHTVGPYWYGGYEGEAKTLASCYIESLKLAMKNNIHSIAFPAISVGNGKYPVTEASEIAVYSVKSFIQNHPDYEMTVVLMCFDDTTLIRYRKSNLSTSLDILKYLKRKEIHVNTKLEGEERSLAKPGLFKKELSKEQLDDVIYSVLKRMVMKRKNLILLGKKMTSERVTEKTCDAHGGKRGPFIMLDTVSDIVIEKPEKGLFKKPEKISFIIRPYAFKKDTVEDIIDENPAAMVHENKDKQELVAINLEEELNNF